MASLRVRFSVTVLALVLAGCSKPEGAPGTTAEAPPAPEAARIDCVTVKPMGCSVEAIEDLDSRGCDQLEACLAEALPSDDSIAAGISCDPPILPSKKNAPAEIAAVAVSLHYEGVPSHAAYLFVRGDSGWCPGHELLAPQWNHGGYCGSDFSFDWARPRQREDDPVLNITAGRTCHIPLDQEEIAAGESDIAWRSCIRFRFALTNRGLVLAEQSVAEDSCKDLGLPPEGGA